MAAEGGWLRRNWGQVLCGVVGFLASKFFGPAGALIVLFSVVFVILVTAVVPWAVDWHRIRRVRRRLMKRIRNGGVG